MQLFLRDVVATVARPETAALRLHTGTARPGRATNGSVLRRPERARVLRRSYAPGDRSRRQCSSTVGDLAATRRARRPNREIAPNDRRPTAIAVVVIPTLRRGVVRRSRTNTSASAHAVFGAPVAAGRLPRATAVARRLRDAFVRGLGRGRCRASRQLPARVPQRVPPPCRPARRRTSHGNCNSFVCRYHGWAYALDGRLAVGARLRRRRRLRGVLAVRRAGRRVARSRVRESRQRRTRTRRRPRGILRRHGRPPARALRVQPSSRPRSAPRTGRCTATTTARATTYRSCTRS